jgi:hypothetical protein
LNPRGWVELPPTLQDTLLGFWYPQKFLHPCSPLPSHGCGCFWNPQP